MESVNADAEAFGDLEKVATLSEKVKEKEFEETKKLWDRAFNQPYEKAGGEVPLTLEGVISIKSPVYWEDSGTDVNTKYRSFFQDFYWRSISYSLFLYASFVIFSFILARMFELCCLLMLNYDHDFIM